MDELGRTVAVYEQVVEEKEFQATGFRLDALHVNPFTHEVSLEYHLCEADGDLIGCTRHITLNPSVRIEGELSDRWDEFVRDDMLDLSVVKSIFREMV